jgi:hypothetical protein
MLKHDYPADRFPFDIYVCFDEVRIADRIGINETVTFSLGVGIGHLEAIKSAFGSIIERLRASGALA